MISVRVYFLGYEANWQRLQAAAVPFADETADQTAARHAVFYNAVLTNFGHINTVPANNLTIFESIVDHLSGGGAITGLESIYLTLLSDPNVAQSTAYQQSLTYWNSGPVATGSDTGAVFLDTAKGQVLYMSPVTLQTLKAGGSNAAFLSSASTFSSNIASIVDSAMYWTPPAVRTPSDPTNPDRPRMLNQVRPPIALPQTPPASAETQAANNAMSSSLGMISGAFAAGAVVTAVAAEGAAGMMAGAALGVLAAGAAIVAGAIALSTSLSPSDSTVVSIDSSIFTGAPVCDQNGDIAGGFSTDPGTGSSPGPISTPDPTVTPDPTPPSSPPPTNTDDNGDDDNGDDDNGDGGDGGD